MCRRELPEMAADPVVVQRGTLKRLDEAMKGFFRRAQAGQRPGFPRFRGRRGFDSLCFVSGVRLVPACPDPFRVSRGGAGARLRLPGFGLLAVRRRGGNPHAHGAPVSAVLKREAGKRYAIVCFRVDAPVREDDGRVVGVDMNAGQAAAVGPGLRSGGVLFHAPDARRLEARAKRLARRLSRQKRGSGRRARTRARLAKTRRRMAGMRRDWRHRTSRAIAGAAHTVIVEDLRVRDMTRSARGTAEEPGSRVRQKAGLNRVVRDTGWAELRVMLGYKAGRRLLLPYAMCNEGAVPREKTSRAIVPCKRPFRCHMVCSLPSTFVSWSLPTAYRQRPNYYGNHQSSLPRSPDRL